VLVHGGSGARAAIALPRKHPPRGLTPFPHSRGEGWREGPTCRKPEQLAAHAPLLPSQPSGATAQWEPLQAAINTERIEAGEKP